jgi:hypothetical protein
MTELSIARSPSAPKRRAVQPSGVSAVKLAQHLDVSRPYLSKLEAEGVFHRLPGGGYSLDHCRIAYLRHLRRERQRTPKSAAEAEFTTAKTRLLQLRIAEKEDRFCELDEAMEVVAALVGMFRTHSAGLAAQCSRDLPTRRAIDKAVHAMLCKIADEAHTRAVELGAPTTRPDDVDD